MIERVDFLANELEAPERVDCLVLVVYILKKCPKYLLLSW